MKKLRTIITMLLVLTMALSSIGVFAEETSVTNAAALRLRDYDVVLQVAPTDYCFVYNFIY